MASPACCAVVFFTCLFCSSFASVFFFGYLFVVSGFVCCFVFFLFVALFCCWFFLSVAGQSVLCALSFSGLPSLFDLAGRWTVWRTHVLQITVIIMPALGLIPKQLFFFTGRGFYESWVLWVVGFPGRRFYGSSVYGSVLRVVDFTGRF